MKSFLHVWGWPLIAAAGLVGCTPTLPTPADTGAHLHAPVALTPTQQLQRLAPTPGLQLPDPLRAAQEALAELEALDSDEEGMASWYGPGFHGKRTASGERFDRYALTAAHPSLPFGTLVCVFSPKNHKSVVVRINDRGPFSKKRIIDLSQGAAQALDITGLRAVQLWRLPDGQDNCPDPLLTQTETEE